MKIKFIFLISLSVILAQENFTNFDNGSVIITQTEEETPAPVTLPVTEEPTTTTTTTTEEPKVLVNPERECAEDYETKFVYTPCDKNGNRWKVQVPRQTGACRITNPKSPVTGIKCSFTCEAGEFLNINTQECQKCPQGTASVGDSVQYSNFRKLPENVDTYGHSEITKGACKNAGWKVKEGYLESAGSSCRSVLKYYVELAKEGNITFTVKSSAVSSFFHVWVETGSTCSSTYDTTTINSGKETEMYYTLSDQWKTHKLDLDKGHNTVNFVAAYFTNVFLQHEKDSSYESNDQKSVVIKDITVRGFAYSPECKRCEEGYYSPKGASECSPCPENTFSRAGSGSCMACAFDEYSGPHAKECIKRKPCTEDDYSEYWEPCKNAQTRKGYKWNTPRICNIIRGVKLPLMGDYIDCPPCNPGLFINGTICSFCEKGTYSHGKECKRCPPETAPAPGLYYKFWTQVPNSPMHLFCLARPSSGCHTNRGWVIHDSYISSGIGHADDAELLMYIKVEKFTKKNSNFMMEFEIVNCNGLNCRLKVQTIDAGHVVHDIGVYEGNQAKTKISSSRYSDNGCQYRLMFEKKYEETEQTYRHSTAQVKIYSIEITDVENGGTRQCEPCAAGKGGDCVTCESGNYLTNSRTCQKCPRNTYLPEDKSDPVGINSCLPCPTGTVSEPGSTKCHSNCYVKVQDEGGHTREYNLTALAGPQFVHGPLLFTSKGYKFFHGFTISLCGHPYEESQCNDNATTAATVEQVLHAAICRSTFIPDEEKLLSTQSISIGDSISNIHSISLNPKKNKTLIDGDFEPLNNEIHFKYHAARITDVCNKGTTGTVRLICDPTAGEKGKVTFGNDKCQSETCDGCNYHFTWNSRYACAKCTVNDYEKITTSCVEGEKHVRYRWKEPHACMGGIDKPADEKSDCTIFEKSILDFKLIIMGFLVGAVLLAAIVIVLCYRNRSLSYKYHRLIDASQMKDGELPPSEKCALESEDEDEDEVILARGKGRTRFLDRLKGIGKKKQENFSEFETINLDKNMALDDDEDEDEL